ncbi:hypothetical protein M9M90_20235 [Phenylobacterium sp. LH3H17]|uniref:hypothetical protein n=1 Tax=Phenylobacterium sp. LH3H17 TaxID=2903901 RepID=UPI0020C9FC9D|nr:hypothetical protein [Phenylobacterium sp. LH3H17]UTP39510.1 hypothetical protein M9M90_20235 [Phenylobacterium sp. LH3H17]
MDPRARFLLWFGLPVLSAGLGAAIAILTGIVEGFDVGGLRLTPLLAVGLYVAGAGLVAVIVRMRQSQLALGDRERFERPLEAALVAMCAPFIVAGLWAFGANLFNDFGSVKKASGQIERVEAIGGLRARYALTLDNAVQPYVLPCYGRPNCGQAVPLMRLPKGAKADLYLSRNEVIGMTVDDKNVLKPFGQRAWRIVVDGALLVLMVLYTTAFLYTAASLLWPEDEDEEEDETAYGGYPGPTR